MLKYVRQSDMILTLTKYEFKLRYRGTLFGVLWSLISPFLLTLVLYVVFRGLSEATGNFATYILVGVFTCRFFSTATSAGMFSIISKPNLVTKTNIPREILPLTTTLAYSISSFLEILILIPLVYYLSGKITILILMLPLIHGIYSLFVCGVNLIISALMVHIRDLNQIWEVILTILFFGSPIAYPVNIVPKDLLSVYMLNPLVRVIGLYRGLIMYDTFSVPDFLYFFLFSLMSLIVGHLLFSRMQRRFGELL
ncbi:MAG: ABC transporter permease [Candidatus Korarchaeum sp.]